VTSKPFKFRLERVRELRERDEDRAREVLAVSLGHQLRGAAMLQAASEQVQDARTSRAGISSGVTGADLVAHERWVERLESERATAELAVQRASAEVAHRRGELVQARQRREALERLKTRQRSEHTAKVARAEGAVLDEIALSAHVRRQQAQGQEHRAA
jgi:flagellar export protein FliJ